MKNKKQKPKKINFSICETPENKEKIEEIMREKKIKNLSQFYHKAAHFYYSHLVALASDKKEGENDE